MGAMAEKGAMWFSKRRLAKTPYGISNLKGISRRDEAPTAGGKDRQEDVAKI
jgi:hypothetical protein